MNAIEPDIHSPLYRGTSELTVDTFEEFEDTAAAQRMLAAIEASLAGHTNRSCASDAGARFRSG